MMYDFTLSYEDCDKNFLDFDDFADECEKLDAECHVDWDNKDVTFYDFAFEFDARCSTIKSFLNRSSEFEEMKERQIEVQAEFRRCMASLFF